MTIPDRAHFWNIFKTFYEWNLYYYGDNVKFSFVNGIIIFFQQSHSWWQTGKRFNSANGVGFSWKYGGRELGAQQSEPGVILVFECQGLKTRFATLVWIFPPV